MKNVFLQLQNSLKYLNIINKYINNNYQIIKYKYKKFKKNN